MAHPLRLGLGTFGNERCAESVETALALGYRHLDTGQMYGTEAAVGEGLARSDVPREDVVVATKLDPENLAYDDVLSSAEESRQRLGVDTIDLLYVHWPLGTYDAEETIPAINDLQDRQVVRHLGVSNFTPALLDEAIEVSRTPIYAHQVEMHPLLQQEELVAYAKEHGHWLVAYSPLAQGKVLDAPEVTAVAERHGVSAARVSLAWLLAHDNVCAVPKATSRRHLEDNLAALDLRLDDEDLAAIDAIDREERCLEEGNSIILERYGGAPWNR